MGQNNEFLLKNGLKLFFFGHESGSTGLRVGRPEALQAYTSSKLCKFVCTLLLPLLNPCKILLGINWLRSGEGAGCLDKKTLISSYVRSAFCNLAADNIQDKTRAWQLMWTKYSRIPHCTLGRPLPTCTLGFAMWLMRAFVAEDTSPKNAITIVNCPTRWSLLLIYGFLCWSNPR